MRKRVTARRLVPTLRPEAMAAAAAEQPLPGEAAPRAAVLAR